MNINQALANFPGTNAGHAAAIVLFLSFGIIVDIRLIRGLPFPVGYDGWMFLLGSALGVSTAAMIGKRLSDVSYKMAGPPHGPDVTVEAPSTVSITPTNGTDK